MPPGLSSAMTIKRIHREIADLKKEDLGPIVLAPSDDSLYVWKGSIPGPEGSIYEGGVFNFEVNLPLDYPFSAPRVMFKTRIYHMNISEQGNICIDILKHNWSPALSLFKVMLSLSSLLTDPNPKDPLVPSIATQYVRNRKTHDTTAQQWTELFARPKPPPPPEPVVILSSKAKGKKKSQKEPPSTSTAAASTADSPITIEDSDDDIVSTSKRPSEKRKRDTNTVDIDLVTGNVDEPSSSASRKKRAVGTGQTPHPITTSSRVTESSQHRPMRQLGDVIVIEDD